MIGERAVGAITMSSRDGGNFVARTGTVRALSNISAGDDDEGGEDQQERNVIRRTFRTGTVRVVSRSKNVDVKLLVKGRCRTPTIVGAGCLLIINKGERSFPRSEPIEDRIEIRDYPDLLRRAGAGNTAVEKIENMGLESGLTILFQHLTNTKLRNSASFPWLIKVKLHIHQAIQGDGSVWEPSRECAKLLDDIDGIVDSLEVTHDGVIPSEENAILDGLADEAMNEKRSSYTMHSNSAPHMFGHS